MKTKKPAIVADYADIHCIGIPRALLYYRYAVLWQEFFEGLGVRVVLSDETDRQTVERGELLSGDECCLASKAYMGHVDQLVRDGACDAVFVPSIADMGRRRCFCTKFQALPDLVANTFRGQVRLVSCMANQIHADMSFSDAMTMLAMRFGLKEKQASKLVKASVQAQENHDRELAQAQRKAAKRIAEDRKAGKDVTAVLLVAHPYVTYDKYVGGDVADFLRGMGVQVLLATESDHEACYKESLGFSKTLPWLVNRELVGSILHLRDVVDGIVLVSAFPCGPDSLTNDAVMRCITGVPILNLVVDSRSGTAGLETRVESFVDILRFHGKGGYLS